MFANSFIHLLRSFRSARIRLNPLRSQKLSREGVSMIEPALTASLKTLCDLPISSPRTFLFVAKLLQCVFSKKARFFCSEADVAISVFRKVSITTVLPRFVTTSTRRSKTDDWELCENANNSVSARLSVKSCTNKEHLPTDVSSFFLSIFFGFGFPGFLPMSPGGKFVTSLKYWTWSWACGIHVSCPPSSNLSSLVLSNGLICDSAHFLITFSLLWPHLVPILLPVLYGSSFAWEECQTIAHHVVRSGTFELLVANRLFLCEKKKRTKWSWWSWWNMTYGKNKNGWNLNSLRLWQSGQDIWAHQINYWWWESGVIRTKERKWLRGHDESE